ncbi:MAG: ribosome maturation factor RimP [Hahellaceae bacterium]|nr:ribosome maturation factor RimP [Hahellaceae bacterium]
MSGKSALIEQLLAPSIEAMGYVCWGVEFVSQGKHSTLRVFIEKDDGITLEDCTAVSLQVSGILDVEDPISSEYELEVSSPGMDRLLFKNWQFDKYKGYLVQIKLNMAFEGKRKYQGVLQGMEGDDVVLVVGDHEYLLPIDIIDKAQVVPQFD